MIKAKHCDPSVTILAKSNMHRQMIRGGNPDREQLKELTLTDIWLIVIYKNM